MHARRIYENGTCDSLIDLHVFLHYSLIPSVIIILVLSFLERRSKRTTLDDKIQLLDRRFGFVIPLDLIGTFHNRWTFGFAFGAIANKVMSLFSEEYLPPGVPTWARDNKIIGSVIGFLYTLTWFIVTVIDVTSCPHGNTIGYYEKVIFEWPSLLCLIFLMGRFVHMFIKYIRIYMGADIRNDEKCFLPIHQAGHVRRLFRKPAIERRSWFERKIYTWDPWFKFPSRMIGTTVLSLFCLYIFVSIEYSAYIKIADLLHMSEKRMEQAAPDILWEGYNQTIVSFKEFNEAIIGAWFFTTFIASAVTVSYIFHILICYRKHMKRLWVGEKGFLPIKFQNPSSSQCVAAIARYSGWQVAYILWGYLIMHIVQCLFGLFLVYAFVFPIKHGQGLELLKGLGISILTLGIGISLVIFQILLASNFFLQKKIDTEDKQKPLALNNRKAFHNFNYFFFFYNVILGLGACLFRLFSSLMLGSWLIARIDRTLLQRGYESADMGYSTWIGMIYVDHYHNNPVLVSFCNILLTVRAEKRLKESPVFHGFTNSGGPRISVRSRTRWLLYYTLLNNPRLITQRKQKEMDELVDEESIMQNRLIQASVLEVTIRNIHDRPLDSNSVKYSEANNHLH
ncbi:stimulated by retinoic acid gene 6 protein-like isoform X2 [Dendropsophus ebraccatus]|uniref:stimulated by retinoic acid gene 6 protein-like isoform X2 n=1 Tax=Dendropsophus ebraccatus TaxID=150705 RepID=UPI0038316AD5